LASAVASPGVKAGWAETAREGLVGLEGADSEDLEVSRPSDWRPRTEASAGPAAAWAEAAAAAGDQAAEAEAALDTVAPARAAEAAAAAALVELEGLDRNR